MTLNYLNDTNRPIRIHGATKEHGIDCIMDPIQPQQLREFDIPDGKDPFLKLWDHGEHLTLLVSYISKP